MIKVEPNQLSISQEKLHDIVQQAKKHVNKGRLADYIPELARANKEHVGIAILDLAGEEIQAGDTTVPFTMQSISKILSLALALMDQGEEVVFTKVGMEPSGDPFNSIVKLETMKPNKPLNPMINAGAIAVCSLIKGENSADKLERLLQLVRQLSANPTITYNEEVAISEQRTANLNRSLAYFLKEHGVISDEVEEVLDLYFKQCAIEICCSDLARIGAVLANDGRDIHTHKSIIPTHIARICKTFMVTCGMYDASGEFAIQVGIPAKSGVAGGILAVVPGKFGLGVFGPALDEKGNSVAGVEVLKEISKHENLSIF